MEREFKWAANTEQFTAICEALSLYPAHDSKRSMDATYFDTPNQLLRERKIGLRLRQENTQTICCMKLRNAAHNGLHVHEEYECPAMTLSEGLSKLPSVGAPAELCQALSKAILIPIARVRFSRLPIEWNHDKFCAELCLDCGYLSNDRQEVPFCEIECEYQSGNLSAFESACTQLAQTFGLCAEPHSKLARALSL
ncbi:MAG: CYTH domain-containing protein [Butyricicoccus pullicaecorum]|nr:CYTH domain-containing protein [Butyricicoccus pullicaecorum]MDO4668525.1 CYTH domain-containing protein [Butyricicoccus pullicaecorum]